MGSHVQRLTKQGIICPPTFLADNLHYEVIMGSVAYGTASESSDVDVYGFCIPPKDVVFPHMAGELEGFGRQKKRFNEWSEHHVKERGTDKTFDFSIYNIVKYFSLCMECNPNMIDSLFVPRRCVLHTTEVGEMVRSRRRMFLHRGAWYKFRGYAFSQMHKIDIKNPEGSRRELIERYGYDVKFGGHVVRLLLEVEQILVEQDIDLERHREVLKAVRRGEWTLERLKSWFAEKEPALDKEYNESTLRHSPDEAAIKQLLLDCLEHHYGSLAACIVIPDIAEKTLGEIRAALERYEHLSREDTQNV
jgi:predicted nucleotidyltransferase